MPPRYLALLTMIALTVFASGICLSRTQEERTLHALERMLVTDLLLGERRDTEVTFWVALIGDSGLLKLDKSFYIGDVLSRYFDERYNIFDHQHVVVKNDVVGDFTLEFRIGIGEEENPFNPECNQLHKVRFKIVRAGTKYSFGNDEFPEMIGMPITLSKYYLPGKKPCGDAPWRAGLEESCTHFSCITDETQNVDSVPNYYLGKSQREIRLIIRDLVGEFSDSDMVVLVGQHIRKLKMDPKITMPVFQVPLSLQWSIFASAFLILILQVNTLLTESSALDRSSGVSMWIDKVIAATSILFPAIFVYNYVIARNLSQNYFVKNGTDLLVCLIVAMFVWCVFGVVRYLVKNARGFH